MNQYFKLNESKQRMLMWQISYEIIIDIIVVNYERNSEICIPSNKLEKFHKPKTPITVEKSQYNCSKKIVISIVTRLPMVKDKCDLFNV